MTGEKKWCHCWSSFDRQENWWGSVCRLWGKYEYVKSDSSDEGSATLSACLEPLRQLFDKFEIPALLNIFSFSGCLPNFPSSIPTRPQLQKIPNLFLVTPCPLNMQEIFATGGLAIINQSTSYWFDNDSKRSDMLREIIAFYWWGNRGILLQTMI